MKPIRTYIFQKVHRSGKITWVVRWKDPKTGRICNYPAGKIEQDALLAEAEIRQKIYKGENPLNNGADQQEPRIGELCAQTAGNSNIVEKGRFCSAPVPQG